MFQGLDLAAGNERLIRLNIDYKISPNTLVGLRYTVGAAGVIAPRHDRTVAGVAQGKLKPGIVDREVRGNLGDLGGHGQGQAGQQDREPIVVGGGEIA